MNIQDMKDKKKPSIKSRVAEYLKTGHSLDLSKAMMLFGPIRLSDHVRKLRKEGYDIRTMEAVAPNGTFFSYYLLPRKIDKDTAVGTKALVTHGPFKGTLVVIGEIDREANNYPVRASRINRGDECFTYHFTELTPHWMPINAK